MELDEVEMSEEDRYRSSNSVLLGVDVLVVLIICMACSGVALYMCWCCWSLRFEL